MILKISVVNNFLTKVDIYMNDSGYLLKNLRYAIAPRLDKQEQTIVGMKTFML